MGESEDALNVALKRYLSRWRDVDLDNADMTEILSLRQRLLDKSDILGRLSDRFGIDLFRMLEIVFEHRFRWSFGNAVRMFEGRTLAEVEAWAGELERAAQILDLAGPLLQNEWAESLQRRAGIRAHFEDATEETLKSEEYEIAETWELARLGEIEISDGYMQTELPRLLDIARGVLAKAAGTLRRRDLPNAMVGGRRVFSRGRRAEYVLQTECAYDLVEYFKAAAKQPLYRYVNILLQIVYPETCGAWWSASTKRPENAVKQLLKQDRPREDDPLAPMVTRKRI